MHAVDRGPEPSDLKAIRKQYTPGWVAYYPGKTRKKPTDSRWQDFHGKLSEAFNGICGYCEDECKGEVDHFRPKKTFPKQVYWWTNWVFACHECNNKKGEKWTAGGYVDPCAKTGPLSRNPTLISTQRRASCCPNGRSHRVDAERPRT